MDKRLKRILSILLTTLVAMTAIYFSGQSGEESHALSGRAARWLLDRLYFTNTVETLELIEYLLRRGAHFIIYTVMGWGLMRTFQDWVAFPLVATVMIGALFACTDEIHQIFSIGRSAKLTDVFLDTCGVTAGGLLQVLQNKLR